ncbi:SGNH/GDSL hydrolase family protein [Cohnella luojiensis]|uniref:SGNH/GDSL hydrolase family protein n=1 Tax=Cohnella luojiensis TaxID=652876 RepID=A0A4Y8LZX0_9BACL|nr:SGNH/GDSL hydrolase family protein [Cohnella luojiensis]TFE26640.1 SGNH/GDSL hydrolase family protein [Cohnella luojiensis]
MSNQSNQFRGGLPRLKNKLNGQDRIVVAFLGGSITEGAGASDPDATSWRALIGQYLRERYSQERVTFINAGVGGTTSTFGAHRLREHVLSHGEIDLLFVEFSVNDGEDREESIRGMEGIVRQCRSESPRTDIVFVYTAADKNLVEGVPFNIAVHEEVAARYDIPSVNFASRIRLLAESGQTRWEELANDRVHPNDAGYAIYASYMREFLELALGETSERNIGEDAGDLPSPLVEGNYEFASMKDLQFADVLDGFSVKGDAPGPLMNWRYRIVHLHAEEPGASLSFSVSGRGAGILLLHGPDSGIFEYSLDGVEYHEVNLFDEWCLMAYRPIIAMFPNLPERENARITIRHTARKDIRSKGTDIRILRFLNY